MAYLSKAKHTNFQITLSTPLHNMHEAFKYQSQ